MYGTVYDTGLLLRRLENSSISLSAANMCFPYTHIIINTNEVSKIPSQVSNKVKKKRIKINENVFEQYVGVQICYQGR